MVIGTVKTFQNDNKRLIFNFESNGPSQIHLRTFKSELKTSIDSQEKRMKIYFVLFIIGSASKYFYVDQNEVFYSSFLAKSIFATNLAYLTGIKGLPTNTLIRPR